MVWDGLAWGVGMGKALLYGRGERVPDHYTSQLLSCGEHVHPTSISKITYNSLHLGHSMCSHQVLRIIFVVLWVGLERGIIMGKALSFGSGDRVGSHRVGL